MSKPDDTKLQEMYNSDYDRLNQRTPSFEEKVKMDVPARFEFFSRFFNEGDELLDCGCNDGYTTYILSKQCNFKSIHGIDISDKATKICNENLMGMQEFKGGS